MRYYTGIGSRSTPNNILHLMTSLAKILVSRQFTLRSGGAEGADIAFENGAKGIKEIYLPWKNFNFNTSPLFDISQQALDLAAKYHPAWNSLKLSHKKLMARNCYQVLGSNLNNPSKFVVCWTLDGVENNTTSKTGGTGQAIRIANAYNIPVFNLARVNRYEELINYIKEFKK